MNSGVLYSRLVHSCSLHIRPLIRCFSQLKFILALPLLIIASPIFSQTSTQITTEVTPSHSDLEYRIKAAYLYNLSKFIQWPGETADSQEPIDICLFGSNPFNDYIYKLEQRKARGRPIKIIDNPASEQLTNCEIIFVPVNASKSNEFLASLKSTNILTVGESDVFIGQGGIINLNLENGRVQLTINNTKAKNSGFIISANLLEIARKVD